MINHINDYPEDMTGKKVVVVAAVLLVLMLWNSLQQEMLRFLLWR